MNWDPSHSVPEQEEHPSVAVCEAVLDAFPDLGPGGDDAREEFFGVVEPLITAAIDAAYDTATQHTAEGWGEQVAKLSDQRNTLAKWVRELQQEVSTLRCRLDNAREAAGGTPPHRKPPPGYQP